MPKATAELIVITKMYDLVIWGCQHVARFPRSHKFTIGDRLIDARSIGRRIEMGVTIETFLRNRVLLGHEWLNGTV